MNTQAPVKTAPKIIMVLAKLCEIGAWILVVCLLLGIICMAVNPSVITEPLREAMMQGQRLDINGFQVLTSVEGTLNPTSLTWALVCGLITMSLSAMIIRNVYLIMKKLDGSVLFDDGNTPFTPDITRMVREIGIFLIAIPVTELIFSWLMNLILQTGIETSVDLQGLLVGLVVWYLSRIFSYGQQLQQDVDGLV